MIKVSKRIPEMFRITLFAILCMLFLFTRNVLADNVVYTTKDGTWKQLNDTTWVMDKDGDGNADITLVKNGNSWQYMFVVADSSAAYYGWEDDVPEGYEVEGAGTRANPVVNTISKFSHTPNIDDSGTQSGNYANSYNQNEVVTIPGASKLHVSITYKTESVYYDWVCMWVGDHPDYTAYSNYSSSLTGKLGGSPSSAVTTSYDVNGDTVTFGFRSDISTNNYGYYAVVTGVENDFTITNKSTVNPSPDSGNLTLTKQVTGDVPADQNFKFNISLSAEDADIQRLLEGERTYGDLTFNDGKAFVYLTPGSTVSLSDIPAGTAYNIEEVSDGNYTVAWSGDGTGADNTCSGTVTKDATAAITCTNTPVEVPAEETGSVTVTKKVVNGSADDTFSFHTAFWGLKASAQYSYTADSGEVTFAADASGMADISYTLADGQSVVFNGLPVGCQYQTIEDANGYIASYDIQNATEVVQARGENTDVQQALSTAKESLDKDESATVLYTNTSKDEPKTDVTKVHVEKVWNDSDDAAGLRPDNITIQLLQDDDVIATALLDEDNSWSTDFTDLDIYQEDGKTEYVYTVSEVEVPGYQSAVTSEDTATGKSVTITNTAINTGNLKVSKTVTGDGADLTKEFQFSVKLRKDGSPVKGVYQLDDTQGTKSGSVAFDSDGVATFTLKDGESAFIKDLPASVVYTVTETKVAGYEASNDGYYVGSIASGVTSTVDVTNTYSPYYSLGITKVVKGNQGNRVKDFHFQLTLTGRNVPDTLEYVKNGYSGSADVVNGVVEFTLTHGEKITFLQMPAGTRYSVSELDGESDGYTVEKENSSGTINSNTEVIFTNTKNVGVPTDSVTNTAILAVLMLGCAVGLLTFRRKNSKKEQ